MSHCICPTYPPFLRDNLRVTHANPIPTSSFNVYGPIRGNQPSNPNYSLDIVPIFLSMVIFLLTIPGSRIQRASNNVRKLVIINLSYSCYTLFEDPPFMFRKWHILYWNWVSIWSPVPPFSYLLSNPQSQYPPWLLLWLGEIIFRILCVTTSVPHHLAWRLLPALDVKKIT